MNTTQGAPPPAGFSPTPSIDRSPNIAVTSDDDHGAFAVMGVLVGTDGDPTAATGCSRDRLKAAGFDASVGSTFTRAGGDGPVLVAVGTGSTSEADADSVRAAAAAFARAAVEHSELALSLGVLTDGLAPEDAAQAAVEGVLLARYRYDVLRSEAKGGALTSLTLVGAADQVSALERGARRGQIFAAATAFARDLANTPHSHLDAEKLGEIAARLGPERGLQVTLFDKAELVEMGCGGLLGVNQGSTAPPRMIKVQYRPSDGSAAHHLTLVGKGIMYDAGGIGSAAGTQSYSRTMMLSSSSKPESAPFSEK